MDPYRAVIMKEDVVNTRLDGLEKNIVQGHMWRAICFAFVALFLGACAITTLTVLREKDSATCHGEVLVNHGTASLRCSHKNHKMAIVTHDYRHVVVSCTCEP